jgi:hypothetical protein
MTAELEVVEAIPTVVVIGVVLPVEVKAVEDVGAAIYLRLPPSSRLSTWVRAPREAVIVVLLRVEAVEASDLEAAIDAVILGKVAALNVGVVKAPNEDQDSRAVDLRIVIVAAACTGKYQIENRLLEFENLSILANFDQL